MKTIEQENDRARRVLRERSERVGDCVLWRGCRDKGGYGVMRFRSRNDLTHRVSFEVSKGSIPEGAMILHSCDVRNCINPEHLRPGDARLNADDMVTRGRAPKFGTSLSYKLTESQIDAIVLDRRTQRIIAKQYGVSQAHIAKIQLGKTRKNGAPSRKSKRISMITDELLREIRTCAESNRVLAKRLGISHQYIGSIRAGHSHAGR